MRDILTRNVRVVPRNFGPLRDAQANARLTGPCGDTMEFWLEVRDRRIRRAAFTSDGCEASIACGSAAARLVEGKTIAAALRLGPAEVLAAVGEAPEKSRHCALLAVNALAAALAASSGRPADEPAAGPAAEPPPDPEAEAAAERLALARRLDRIRHTVLVLSGKGGVGKSTVAVNLAVSLARAGRRVGLLDVDIHGPSVPRMLGIERVQAQCRDGAIVPVETRGLKVMSLGLLLLGHGEAVIWRGPRKMAAIRQLLADVEWGDLDFLIVDLPPGTGDEPLSICQLIRDADGAVLVTTPQEVAADDARRAVTFCRQLRLPVLGLIENMSGFVCPHCGQATALFREGGGRRLARKEGVAFLGGIPFAPDIGASGDTGLPFVLAPGCLPARGAFEGLVELISGLCSDAGPGPARQSDKPS